MEIIAGRPPNFEQIARAFPAARALGTIFTYGEKVYVSDGAKLPPSLIAHECVHILQQGKEPQAWWDLYIANARFRFEQELEAHRKELELARGEGNRKHRRMVLTAIAKRLSGPLYGNCVPLARAKKLLEVPDSAIHSYFAGARMGFADYVTNTRGADEPAH